MSTTPALSVVVPVFNERDNIEPLLEEIRRALEGLVDYEVIYVDDASTDDTLAVLLSARARHPRLRVLQHARQCGQSTAVYHGVRAARSGWVATLDGDGQNDPADIRKLLAARDAAPARTRLFAGWRTSRRDNLGKRLSSRIANGVRKRVLRDDTPDTGCGLKLFDRAVFLELPYFDHMHRFLPALVRRHGHDCLSVPVSHRPRTRGVSKYGMWNRLWVGLSDLRGVGWLMRRTRLSEPREF